MEVENQVGGEQIWNCRELLSSGGGNSSWHLPAPAPHSNLAQLPILGLGLLLINKFFLFVCFFLLITLRTACGT